VGKPTMVPMISSVLKPGVTRLINPVAKWAVKIGITPNAITIAGALVLPFIEAKDPISYLGILTLITGILIPYIRAKAESFGIECSVGIAERTERLIIILVAAGLHGLGVPFVIAIGFWLLASLGVITVFQRIFVVYKGLHKP